MKKNALCFLMMLMVSLPFLGAAAQKVMAADIDSNTVAEQIAADDPVNTGMAEGSGIDLFGNARTFPCWYNKETDLYYMEDVPRNVYVYDSQRWTITRAYRIVDSQGDEHYWYGANEGSLLLFEDGGYLSGTKVFDKNGNELGTAEKTEVIGFAAGYGDGPFVGFFKKLLTGNNKASSEEVLQQTVTSDSSLFSESENSDNAPAVTAMAGVTGVWDFYSDLFGLRGPDGANMPFYVFCNDSQFYSGSGLGKNSYSTTFYDEEEKRTCAVIALGYKEDLTAYPVIGHEVTHRYFDCLVKAKECDEKRALDEGFADIMGFLFADWFDGDENREPGERMDGTVEWINTDRDIQAIIEGQKDYPVVYKGEHWDPENDEHQNSTVITVAAYKMIQAPDDAGKFEQLSSYQLSQLFFGTMKAMDENWDGDYPHCAYALRRVASDMVKAKELSQKQADYVDHILVEAGLPASSAPEDTREKNTAAISVSIKAPVTSMKNGRQITEWDCVLFGYYWQDTDSNGDGKVDQNDNKTPIKWRVLSYDEASGEALLLSDRNLDILKYNKNDEAVDWNKSTLRSFLNSYGPAFNQDNEDYSAAGFLNNAFIPEETSAILDTLIPNEDNKYFGSEGGPETKDKVFCLSLDEALNKDYGFIENEIKGEGQEWTNPDTSRVSYNTAFVAAREDFVSQPAGSAQRWWLRSPAYTTAHAAHADNDGAVNFAGMGVTHTDAAIRPAVRINLKNSAGLWTYAGTVSSGE